MFLVIVGASEMYGQLLVPVVLFVYVLYAYCMSIIYYYFLGMC